MKTTLSGLARALHPGRAILVGPAFAVAFAVAAVLGRMTLLDGSQLALVWPAAGVGFLWVLWEHRSGSYYAMAGALAGIVVLTTVIPVLDGAPVRVALVFALANAVLALSAVVVFVWLGGSGAHRLESPRHLWALLLGSVAGSIVSGVVGPTLLMVFAQESPAAYPLWVVRNAVSIFVLVATTLRLVRVDCDDVPTGNLRWEFVAACAVLVIGYGAVFALNDTLPISFAVLALCVWFGLRFSTGVAAASALVSGLAVVLTTMAGRGPFIADSVIARGLLAQGFIAVLTLVTLVLALQRDTQARLAVGLVESEERFRSAFETAPVSMLMSRVQDGTAGPIIRANADLAAFTGMPLHRLVGTTPLELVDERDHATFGYLLAGQLEDRSSAARTEMRFVDAAGDTVWGSVSMSTVPDPSGAGVTLLCLVEDITARKAAEEALTRQALHDQLTGLPNRTLLVDRLGRAIRSGGTTRVGVLYLDIDGFKGLNETLGMSGGDDLLIRVGGRIAGCVAQSDTVARLGGDEFAVVCEGVDGSTDLEAVADRVRAALAEPVHVAGTPVVVQASIGVALAEPDSHPEAVLRQADHAMSNAKNSGRDRVESLVWPEQARAARTARLLPELERALAEEQFELFGQPVVDIATGRTVAVETLLRWNHPQRGLQSPAEFLDVLEASSLMTEAGTRVLALSLRMARQWLDALGPEAPVVHINISGKQLQSGHLSEALRTAQVAAGVPMSQIVLELTETHAPLIADSLLADVNDLRRDGARIALDDLGTGYSSLMRITELPTDILKIDRSFVSGLGTDPRCSAIVRGVLSMSQALGLSVVAEGVETQQQHDLLHEYQCDTAQGFLYARPLPADQLLALMTGTPSLLPQPPLPR
ncbi:EAL domain-containing protein [Solicola sp. PLA-1-18]|uniref:bifunctional diguanylate cyclase/phosphodiesterase n=1 Tax=Solicola sp. PLA-1-18 TaxID=3380532 RepID=UPI003B7E8992